MMKPLDSVRKELESNLNSIVNIQHAALRDLIHETLAFENIQATVFYDMVLRRPRVALDFFNAALQRQKRAVPITEPSGSALRAFLRKFTSISQHEKLRSLDIRPRISTNELTASFRIYLGQLQRRNVTVPTSLQGLVAEERVGQHVTDIVEELEFMSFFNDAIAGNHVVFRDISFRSQNAWGVFIRDALATRETPMTQIEAPDSPAVLELRLEFARLAAAGILPAMNQLVTNFRHQRAGSGGHADENEFLDALIADDLQAPPAQNEFPGFQSTGITHQGDSSVFEEEVVETVFWPDVETFLSTRTGPKPRCLCFCTAELFIASLESSDASQHPEKEPMRKLNCGHVVGAVCMRALEIQSPRCPFCHQPI